MNNIRELMKEHSNLKFTKKIKKEDIEIALSILGIKTYLVVCMEEISELINVATSNICDKLDYIHTAEEIADVYVCMDILQVMFQVPTKKINKVVIKKKKKSILFEALADLSSAQQGISKIYRNKDKSEENVADIINMMNRSCVILTDQFKIKKKDIEKIIDLKYWRLENRISDGSLS